jgi:hypothetical protein
MSTYVHLTPGFLRNEIDRLSFGSAISDGAEEGLVTRLLPAAPGHETEGGSDSPDPEEFPEIPAERDIGFEPTTFSLGS